MAAIAINLRRVLRAYIAEASKDLDEISYADLIEAARRDLGNDEDFAYAAAEEIISMFVPEILREVMRSRRHESIELAHGYVSLNEGTGVSAMERISRVLEGTGSGGYKSLLVHRKAELLALNERDEKQMATTRRWVGFRSELASKMNNTQLVQDLDPQFLDRAWRRHFQD